MPLWALLSVLALAQSFNHTSLGRCTKVFDLLGFVLTFATFRVNVVPHIAAKAEAAYFVGVVQKVHGRRANRGKMHLDHFRSMWSPTEPRRSGHWP